MEWYQLSNESEISSPALLLFDKEVHGRGAFVHLAHLVVLARVV